MVTVLWWPEAHGRPRETTEPGSGAHTPARVSRGLRGARRALSWATSGVLTPTLLFGLAVVVPAVLSHLSHFGRYYVD